MHTSKLFYCIGFVIGLWPLGYVLHDSKVLECKRNNIKEPYCHFVHLRNRVFPPYH